MGALAVSALGQATGFPPTSGNGTTLILGLVSFSLLFLIVGSWIVGLVRKMHAGMGSHRTLSGPRREDHDAR